MNKLMAVVAASVCAVSFSEAAVAADEKVVENKAAAESAEQEDSKLFAAGLDIDLFSAYIWRNVVQTDKPVLQPCVWADFTGADPFWFGFSLWQGWDLSSDRKDTFKRRLNELDYNVHAGVTAWQNEDEDMSLEFEVGHEWYTYHFVRGDAAPSTREFYLKCKFANPLVDVYGQSSWLYDDIGDCESGFHYEVGFNREVELCDALKLGADWNVNFGSANYLEFLMGDVNGGDRPYGIGGTTVKAYLAWAVTDWMSLVGTIAYTGLLNHDVRDEYENAHAEERDIVWGGFSVKFEY